jgi:hypothetical protein
MIGVVKMVNKVIAILLPEEGIVPWTLVSSISTEDYSASSF